MQKTYTLKNPLVIYVKCICIFNETLTFHNQVYYCGKVRTKENNLTSNQLFTYKIRYKAVYTFNCQEPTRPHRYIV